MNFTTTVTGAVAARTIKETAGAETLTEGHQLKVELGPDQELDTECPAGKVWFATVQVHVVETDA